MRQLTKKFAAIAIFTLLFAELHELAHTVPGALMCAGFGERDFNAWTLKSGCDAILPTVLGPVFTFGVAWLAAWYAWKSAPARPSRAWLLLISTALFGRLFTAALGGGDEVTVARYLLAPEHAGYGRWLALAVVIALSAPPLYVTYQVLGQRWRRLLLYTLAPFGLLIVVVLLAMNTLLASGVLSSPVVLGSPLLVHLYLAGLLLLTPLAWRWAGEVTETA
jgi:hypothetical protein